MKAILSLLAALLLTLTTAECLAATTPQKGATDVIATASNNVLVANRGAVSTSLLTIADGAVHWREHTVSPEGDVTAIQFVDCGFYISNAGVETVNPDHREIQRYLEAPANTFTRVTWRGAVQVAVPSAFSCIKSDPLPITLHAASLFIEHTIQATGNSISAPVIDIPATPAVLGLSEGAAASFTSTSGFNNSNSSGTQYMGAAAIIGTVKTPHAHSVVMDGDGVPTWALHDDTSTGAAGGSGFVARGLDPYYPWMKIGNAGLSEAGFAAQTGWKSLVAMFSITDFFDTLGGNDLFNGQTDVQLLASKQLVYTAINATVSPKPRIWVTTETVNTTSTNSWATALTNQTPPAWAVSYLVSVNTSIMAGLPQTYKSVDENAKISAATNSLNWAAPDQTNIFQVLTTTGPYLTSYASNRAAAAVVDALDLPIIARTQALLSRMSVQPNVANKRAINAHMTALVSAGVLPHLDAYYVMQSHDQQAATLNWVGPTFTLTLNNAPTFTASQGFAGNGTSSYEGTGDTPSVTLGHFSQNAAVIGEFILSKTTGATIGDAGSLGTTTATTALASAQIPTGLTARVNDLTGLAQGAVVNSAGCTWGLRSGASARSAGRDSGVALTSDTAASTGLTSSELAWGHLLSVQYSTRLFSDGWIGDALTGRQITAICDAEHIHNTLLNP